MSDFKLPNRKELETFNNRLNSNRSGLIKIFNGNQTQSIKATPLGHVSPEQFKQIAHPAYFTSSFESLSDESLERNVDYKMEDLTESIRKHGVLRPVLIDNTLTDNDDPDGGLTKIRQRVIDGNHRAVAAIRAGAPIPTYVLHKNEKWWWS